MDQFGVVVLGDLPVDGLDAFLHCLVRELAVRVIDDGDEHVGLLSMRAAWSMDGVNTFLSYCALV